MSPEGSPTHSGQSISYNFEASPLNVYAHGIAAVLEDDEVSDLTQSPAWGLQGVSPLHSLALITSTAKTNGRVARQLNAELEELTPSANAKPDAVPSSPTQSRPQQVGQGNGVARALVFGIGQDSPRPTPGARHRLARVSCRAIDTAGIKRSEYDGHTHTSGDECDSGEMPGSRGATKRQRLDDRFSRGDGVPWGDDQDVGEKLQGVGEPFLGSKVEEVQGSRQRRVSTHGILPLYDESGRRAVGGGAA